MIQYQVLKAIPKHLLMRKQQLSRAATRGLVATSHGAGRSELSVARSYTTATKPLLKASKMDTLKTGTSAYMDLYPEQSTDGGT